jgi:predicted alpha/beta superfamily hydrolase
LNFLCPGYSVCLYRMVSTIRRIMNSDCSIACRMILRFVCSAMVCAILILQSAGCARVGSGHDDSAVPVTIPGTQLLTLSSSTDGYEYNLLVHLPQEYQDSARSFPVLYLLDAQWDFPLVTAIYGQQHYDGFVPAAIIVGITWGGEHPDHDSLRVRDLTPTHVDERPQSGHAAGFLAFLKAELIPHVESHYRTVQYDRTLMGSSLGGLLTLNALFQETGLFHRYVLTSPALSWDDKVIDTYESRYAAKNTRLPVRLFMAVGEYEDVGTFQQFVDRLKTRKYGGLEMQTRVLEGMGHSGSKAEGFTRGLQDVFARSSVDVGPAVLEEYAGIYRGKTGIIVRIERRADSLLAGPPGATAVPLYAESEADFYVKGQSVFLHFMRDSANEVSGVLLKRFAGEDVLTRETVTK